MNLSGSNSTTFSPSASVPVLLLAGGFGTRLRSVDSTRPKPMVLVEGKPFLHWLVAYYVRQGFRHFLISTGYLAEIIEQYPWAEHFQDCRFEFYRESTPLGTGGAVRRIFQIKTDLECAWVINADTLLPQILPSISGLNGNVLYLTLSPSEIFDATPNLQTDGSFIIGESSEGQVFDAGAVYINRRAVIGGNQSEPPFSLHQLLLPQMNLRLVHYLVLPGTCYDIGTPQRLQRFVQFITEHSLT